MRLMPGLKSKFTRSLQSYVYFPSHELLPCASDSKITETKITDGNQASRIILQQRTLGLHLLRLSFATCSVVVFSSVDNMPATATKQIYMRLYAC